MSTDECLCQADKVGVSTDVSGIVKEIDVHENQKVEGRRRAVPPRRPAVPARAGARRGAARDRAQRPRTRSRRATGTCRPRSSRPRRDIDYYTTQFQRQQELAGQATSRRRPTFDTARHEPAERRRRSCASLERAARRRRRQPERRSRMRRSSSTRATGGRGAARRGRAPARPHGGEGADSPASSPMSPRCSPASISPASTAAFSVVATDHVWIEAKPKETELTYVRPGRAGDGDGRHLSGRDVARHRRQHQPGLGARASRCCRRRTPPATG